MEFELKGTLLPRVSMSVEEKGELVAIGSAPRRNAEIVEPLLHYLTGFLHFALGR
jgi:hypothetical protein